MYEKRIIERNPWWQTNTVSTKLTGINRTEYLTKINIEITNRKILAILGIRRSGKSTLIYQTINTLIKNKTNPKNILYINTDDLEDNTTTTLEKALDFYQQQNNTSLKDQKTYIFIDEIQNIKDWQLLLKKYYDLKYDAKFIVSGSSSSLIYKNSSESLVGRIQFLNVFPLSFKEFLQFNNFQTPTTTFNFESFKKTYKELAPNENKIISTLNKYIEVGGFPEWFEIKNKETWYKTLKEQYISLLLYKDIIKVFSIRDPLLLESIFRFTAAHSTERFSYLGIANKNDGDKETAKQYIYHLAHSRLIYISEYYTKSKKASERKEKKIYFCDLGLKNSLDIKQDIGFDAENIAFLHCLKSISETSFGKIFYWFGKKKDETDIVISKNSELIPIEVKYRSTIEDKNLKGILEFSKKFNTKSAFVVTKNLLDQKIIDNTTIYFIPLWLFLIAF